MKRTVEGLISNEESQAAVDEFMRENYLLYYDFNSLYSSCMIQELLTGEMEWSTILEYEPTLDGENNYGYIYMKLI